MFVCLLMCFVFMRSDAKLMFLMLIVVILTMNTIDSSIRRRMSLIIVKFVNVMMDLMVMVWLIVFSFMSCVMSLELMCMPMGILVLVKTMVALVMEERSKVVGISEVDLWSMEVSDAIILLGYEASESIIGCFRV